MKKMTIIWGLIILFLILILGLVGINKNKLTKDYKALENDLVEAAKVYYGQDTNLKKLPNENQSTKITISELISFGVKLNNKVNDDSCEGYVKVTGKSISYDYKAYIKCHKYTTNSYDN